MKHERPSEKALGAFCHPNWHEWSVVDLQDGFNHTGKSEFDLLKEEWESGAGFSCLLCWSGTICFHSQVPSHFVFVLEVKKVISVHQTTNPPLWEGRLGFFLCVISNPLWCFWAECFHQFPTNNQFGWICVHTPQRIIFKGDECDREISKRVFSEWMWHAAHCFNTESLTFVRDKNTDSVFLQL